MIDIICFVCLYMYNYHVGVLESDSYNICIYCNIYYLPFCRGYKYHAHLYCVHSALMLIML